MSIASEITRLQNAKASIKSSLEAKGATVPSNVTLDQYSTIIDNLPSGGGGSPYLVSSIQERDSLQNVQDGDICIVSSTITKHPDVSKTAAKKIYILDTIIFEEEIQENYENTYICHYKNEYNNNVYNPTFWLRLQPRWAQVYYVNEGQEVIYAEWTSNDGLTYTLTTNTANENYFNIIDGVYIDFSLQNSILPTNLINVDETDFQGIFQYSETDNEWKYYNVGTSATEDNIFYPYSSYTFKGIVDGELNSVEYNKQGILYGTSIPSYSDGIKDGTIYLKYTGILPHKNFIESVNKVIMDPEPSNVNIETLTNMTEFSINNNYWTTDGTNIYTITYNGDLYKYDTVNDTETLLISSSEYYQEAVSILFKNNLIYSIFNTGTTQSADSYLCVWDLTNLTFNKYLFENNIPLFGFKGQLIDTIDDIYFYRNDNYKTYKLNGTTFIEDQSFPIDFIPGGVQSYLCTPNKYSAIVAAGGNIRKIDFYNKNITTIGYNIRNSYYIIYSDNKILEYYSSGKASTNITVWEFNNDYTKTNFKGTILFPDDPQQSSRTIYGIFNNALYRTTLTSDGHGGYLSCVNKCSNLYINKQVPRHFSHYHNLIITTGTDYYGLYCNASIPISDIKLYDYDGNQIIDSVYIFDGDLTSETFGWNQI